MTLEEKLKWLEQNEVYLANSGWSLIQALRKAIEQRDDLIKLIYYVESTKVRVKSNFTLEEVVSDGNKELLEILEGK